MTPVASQPLRLLLVEDNGADLRLFQETLKALSLPISLDIVRDGEEVLAFLQQRAPYAEAQRPDFIFWTCICRRRPASRCYWNWSEMPLWPLFRWSRAL